MTEHTEQTPAPSGAVPARIQLDDFIEAVTRGVTRALAAQEEVSGYAAQLGGVARTSITSPTILVGISPPPTFPGLPDLAGSQGTITERR